MRLLNVHTLQFGEFFASETPPYSILSHRWGVNEPSYKDYRKGINLSGPGYEKIIKFCSFVRKRKPRWRKPLWGREVDDSEVVEWVWIDTICIDKRSSAELSEAINSMFEWYANAQECIVHLADVTAGILQDDVAGQIRASNWFHRGWTLQELLAPELCIFVDKSWFAIGHVCDNSETSDNHCCRRAASWSYGPSIATLVTEITRIPEEFLKPSRIARWKDRFEEASIAQRLSWASHRITTRVEDEAYCLLGLLGINMPLIYGEGKMAFIRLQEQIIKRSSDSSIFAWTMPYNGGFTVLAKSPRYFNDSGNITKPQGTVQELPTYALTNKGLQIEARATQISITEIRAMQEESGSGMSLMPRSQIGCDEEIFLLQLDCETRDSVDGSDRIFILSSTIAIRNMNHKFYRIFLPRELQRRIQWSSNRRICERQFSIEAYPSTFAVKLPSAFPDFVVRKEWSPLLEQ
jgi:hypothetical protein